MSVKDGLRHTSAKSKDPEHALWRAVIVQAFVDATAMIPRVDPNAGKKKQSAQRTVRKEARMARLESREWLLSNGEDFRHVCDMAGVDPGAVHDEVARLINSGWDGFSVDKQLNFANG